MNSITCFVIFELILHVMTGIDADPLFQDDVELLEGFENFNFNKFPFQFDDLNPEDEDNERKHLLSHFMTKSIRNKRAARYKILESEGLRSHFRIDENPYEDIDDFENESEDDVIRVRRSPEVTTDINKDKEGTSEDATTVISELPNPEKLISNHRYYEDHWSQYDKPRDSEADATIYNEGIKARAPRVNFITRNQKSLDASESRNAKSSILPETTTADPYRKNLARVYLDYPRPYDAYPRTYDPYVDRLYDNRRNYDDYYDSYMPRTLSYPNFYYYPDKRYDVPEPRNPILTPDNTNAANAPSVSFAAAHEIPPLSPENRNRRIIYYTTLPEIVRARIPIETYLRSYYRYNPNLYNYYNYLTPHVVPPLNPYFFPVVAPSVVNPYRNNRITRDYTKAIGSITQIRDIKDDFNNKKNGNHGNGNYQNNSHHKNNGTNYNKNGRNDGRAKDGRSSY